ncbi:cupin domain-containing protein [Glaciibacter superstes]|uniref:cupin domain-containing protein n=1 Tax=Glaciibacter superstes TaxID=501023 RepID=UPI0003B46F5C|nr:cupin domain-containing protein [Glaciibacter superstes]
MPRLPPGLQILDHVQLGLDLDRPDVMTVTIELEPGTVGSPPHRHSGPVFGYLIEGELIFELDGEPARVIRAGEAFWEPGGDVIHYRAANNLADGYTKFLAVMMCAPGKEMLTYVSEEELAERAHLRYREAA